MPISSPSATVVNGVDVEQFEVAIRGAGRAADGDRLLAVTAEPIGAGHTADTFRLRLDWARPAPESAPVTVVAKLPSADASSGATAASLGLYEREARFYEELAPQLDVDTPALMGVVEIAGARSGLLLEDLAGAVAPDQLNEAPVELVRRARRQLTALQAPFWDDPRVGGQDWLHRRLGVPIPAIVERMERSWAVSRDRIAADFPAAERDLIDRFVRGAGAWAESFEGPWSLTHHDFRLDNLLLAGDRLIVLDWQTVGWGAPMFDVAYLLGTSLDPATRRAVERDEIARHLDDLAAAGVTWEADEAWEAYRRASFATLLMLVPPAGSTKRTERGDRMFRRLLSLGARMALDLDAADFLEGA